MARVTVGMPVHNGERFIAEHLRAFLDQTFEDFELVVGDNDSTDRTREICLDFAALDPRIRYVRRDRNLGAAANVNLLAKEAKSEYFKLAAHDDLHAPRHLEACIQALDADSSIVLSHTGVRFIDENGDPLPPVPSRPDRFIDFSGRSWGMDQPSRRMSSWTAWERYHDLIHNTVLAGEIWGVIRRADLMRTRLLRPYFGSDRPMLAELALAGRFLHIPEALFALRLHPGNTSRQSWRTRGELIDPDSLPWAMRLTGLQAFWDFGRAIWRSDVSRVEKAYSSWSWATLPFSRRIVRKLLIPGPHNYLGLERGETPR